MKEQWKTIEGYERYEVSTFGCVRKKGSGKKLIPEKTKKGYLRVDLFRDNKRKHMKVHRLVAMAFIENPNNYPQINHRDFNKENNRVWNLEWTTDEKNKEYSRENSFIGETN